MLTKSEPSIVEPLRKALKDPDFVVPSSHCSCETAPTDGSTPVLVIGTNVSHADAAIKNGSATFLSTCLANDPKHASTFGALAWQIKGENKIFILNSIKPSSEAKQLAKVLFSTSIYAADSRNFISYARNTFNVEPANITGLQIEKKPFYRALARKLNRVYCATTKNIVLLSAEALDTSIIRHMAAEVTLIAAHDPKR